MKSYGVTIQTKPLQQYFYLGLFVFHYSTKIGKSWELKRYFQICRFFENLNKENTWWSQVIAFET